MQKGRFPLPQNDLKETRGLKTQNLQLFSIVTHILACFFQKLGYPSHFHFVQKPWSFLTTTFYCCDGDHVNT